MNSLICIFVAKIFNHQLIAVVPSSVPHKAYLPKQTDAVHHQKERDDNLSFRLSEVQAMKDVNKFSEKSSIPMGSLQSKLSRMQYLRNVVLRIFAFDAEADSFRPFPSTCVLCTNRSS